VDFFAFACGPRGLNLAVAPAVRDLGSVRHTPERQKAAGFLDENRSSSVL
jgi:hypothetical protein